MANIKLIVGEKAIFAAAKSILEKSKTWREALHVCLCSALAHAGQYNDPRIVDQVVNLAVVDARLVNLKMVDRWIKANSNLRYREADGKHQYRKPESKPLMVFMDDAMKRPFWEIGGDTYKTEELAIQAVAQNLLPGLKLEDGKPANFSIQETQEGAFEIVRDARLENIESVIAGAIKRLKTAVLEKRVKPHEGESKTAAQKRGVEQVSQFETFAVKTMKITRDALAVVVPVAQEAPAKQN